MRFHILKYTTNAQSVTGRGKVQHFFHTSFFSFFHFTPKHKLGGNKGASFAEL